MPQLSINKPLGQPGIVRTKAGHLRYTSPKSLRGQYVHRHVIDMLLEETSFYVRQLLPWPFEVHHADYHKDNNDPSNLIMVGTSLHSVMTADRPRAIGTGKFQPKWKGPPKWLPLFDEDGYEVGDALDACNTQNMEVINGADAEATSVPF